MAHDSDHPTRPTRNRSGLHVDHAGHVERRPCDVDATLALGLERETQALLRELDTITALFWLSHGGRSFGASAPHAWQAVDGQAAGGGHVHRVIIDRARPPD